jgi:Zn-dependent peptidase ImmA (M78 family)
LRPDWYGSRYPNLEDLVIFGESLGAGVRFGRLPAAAFAPSDPPVLLVPAQHGPLNTAWTLAHEIGHLVQHTGPRGELLWSKDEHQANRWAACALIPEARIHMHHNACLDAFIGALSAHYEDIPLSACMTRRLAAKIAKIRMKHLEVTT